MPNQFTNPWTEHDIKFIQNNIKKLTYGEMSKYINRTPSSIQSKIRYLPYKQKIKKHVVNSFFFRKWSQKMAYTLGFIAADGNICKSGRGHVLHIACDDKDVIEKIRIVLGYEGPIHEKLRPNGKISYSLRICDPIIFYDLVGLNITERKSVTLDPPKIPKKYLNHFIRGYFDGDGSVSVRSVYYPGKLVVDLYTASLKMADFLYLVVQEITGESYTGRVRIALVHQKKPYYAIRLGHKAALKLFKYMYHNASIYLDRKHKKFLEGIEYGS